MKVAIGLASLLAVQAAHADSVVPSFEEYSASVQARPAHQLVERSCDVGVDLRGAVATVELRQRIANTGSEPIAARLIAPLPAGARVTSFSMKHRNATEIAMPVRADSPAIAGSKTAFAVLASTGSAAKHRKAMVAAGGRHERVIALTDPSAPPATTTVSVPTASAISRTTLERLFRDQLQPRAYVCYQRALGTNAKLAGTVQLTFRLGRGEVTEVQLSGLGDAAMDACLLDAAYSLAPPAPDFRLNADDQTIANYPIAFTRKEDKAVIVLGDADSTSPIDLDGVRRTNDQERALRKQQVKVDAAIPLGGMRAPKSP